MSETSQSVMRAVALVVLTAGFAGVWQNDRPADPSIARYVPADQRTFLLARAGSMPTLAPDQPAPEPVVAANAGQSLLCAESTRPESAALGATPSLSRAISLDVSELMITQQELLRHLMQLPLGIAAGEYRIVDPQGGVGWLRVSGEMAPPIEGEARPVLTTGCEGTAVHFIRVDRFGADALTQRP